MTISEKARVVDDDWLKVNAFLQSATKEEKQAYREMSPAQQITFLYDCIQYAIRSGKKYTEITFAEVKAHSKT